MFLCVVFCILGGLCLIGAIPALFSAIASCVSSSTALAGASWGWFAGAIISSLVCFAIGSLIDDEATLKRVRLFDDHIVLEPENPTYRPIVFWNEEMSAVTILGLAVAFTSSIF